MITHKVATFIIQNVQPLYILQNNAFQDLLLTCEPGYKIPCEKTMKGILQSAYKWSQEQLRSLLRGTMITATKTNQIKR